MQLEPQQAARTFFESTGPDYDLVARRATLGRDAAWKRAILQRLPPAPADVLDYACGTGILALAAARCVAPGHVVGVDLSASMLERAREKAAREGLAVRFVQADAERWDPPRAAFDVVLASYLPKYVDIERWLPRAARALRLGGVLIAHDFTYPQSAASRAIWESWWRFLGPRLAARPGWGRVAEELPGLIRRSTWLPDLLRALPRHGFGAARVRRMTFGAATLVEARLRA